MKKKLLCRKPKRILRLPDLDHAKTAVLNTLGSPESQRSRQFAIDDFIAWYCSEPRLAFNKTVVLRYRLQLEAQRLSASTINVRLAAVRRLAYEAADSGLLSPELAASIRRVKGSKKLGIRLGNWLTAQQSKVLLSVPASASFRGKRDRAMLALLLGCGLRRSELVHLTLEHLQQREEHWAIVDLVGKGGHVRTVPVPAWVKETIDIWTATANIKMGKLFRCVNKTGSVWGRGINEKVVWSMVRECASKARLDRLAPHDLRRTCARLCHEAGDELEQIQFLLGHISVQTTERYLGCKQRLREAVNDKIGLEASGTLRATEVARGQSPIIPASSTGRCNTLRIKFFSSKVLFCDLSGYARHTPTQRAHFMRFCESRPLLPEIGSRGARDVLDHMVRSTNVRRLSVRQREVLTLVAQGCNTKQVGAILKSSVKTAETHRAKLMQRIDCHSVVELVRYAIRNHVVEA